MKIIAAYFVIGMCCAYVAMRDFDCGNFDRSMCRGFAISEGMMVTVIWPWWIMTKAAGK